ncbi:MAG: ATP-binding cassette domain-containing protein [Ruminiclostridium sp.]|nr:ATP-binding cassette domain-containing protein [Ruminiclostridium sp.]
MELKIQGLTKKYGKFTALNNVSYEFTDGIYGLLGPNGAGKSTLMNIITQNIKTTSGEVYANGENIKNMGKRYRSLLGFMPQQQAIYPSFTLSRFLFYMASLKNIPAKEAAKQIDELIDSLNLSNVRNKMLGGFSGGMKQRALLAQALLGDPKIVILDEPTAGLDPKERISLRNLIAKAAFNKIVIIATHVVPDIEFIAKSILLLKKGEIIDSGSPEELCGSVEGTVYELLLSNEEFEAAQDKLRIVNISHRRDKVCVRILSPEPPAIFECEPAIPTLEDLYLTHFVE